MEGKNMSDSCDIVEGKKGKKASNGEGVEMETTSDMDAETGDFEVSRSSSLRDLIELERDFQKLRDALYQERTQQINRRLSELNEGCATDYRKKVAALDESFKARLEISAIQRQLQLDELSKLTESAEMAANQDFEGDRINLFDRLKEDLENKIGKLKADKHAADVNLALWMLDSSVDSRKRGRAGGKKRAHRPVSVSGPYIVYMLKEEEIEEDFDAIRRAAIESDLYEHQIFH